MTAKQDCTAKTKREIAAAKFFDFICKSHGRLENGEPLGFDSNVDEH